VRCGFGGKKEKTPLEIIKKKNILNLWNRRKTRKRVEVVYL
jgi:hypothetical protein